MDIKEIKKLIRLVEDANISVLSLDEDGKKIEIRKELSVSNVTLAAPAAPTVATPSAAPIVGVAAKPEIQEDDSNLLSVKSPMVGTFYIASSPDADPYVKEGDRIQEGDVICMVEAMKLFNEIESEVSGVISKVLVKNGDPVEYGQVLFLIEA